MGDHARRRGCARYAGVACLLGGSSEIPGSDKEEVAGGETSQFGSGASCAVL